MIANALGKLAAVIAAAGYLVGCAGGEASSETVGASSAAILNGTAMSEAQVQTWGLAAVYHPSASGGWFPRPCSGSIIRSAGGVSQVLTARHCVTVDSMPNSALASPTQIRVAAAAAPGPAAPNPPASAITAAAIAAMPVTADSFVDRDMAIVTVNADWASRVTSRLGVWVGEPSLLAGTAFTAMGYGINVNDQSCDTDGSTVGAGQARFGNEFTVSGGTRVGSGGDYSYSNLSTGGQAVMCGDSGGPDNAPLGPDEFGWSTILGVHSTGKVLNTPVSSTVTNLWLQSTLGGLFLSSDFNHALDMAASGSTLTMSNSSDILAARFTYDPTAQTVRASGGCIAPFGTGVRLATCDGSPAQRWTITLNRWLKHVASGQCLTALSTGLSLQTCSFATLDLAMRQHWAFHPQR